LGLEWVKNEPDDLFFLNFSNGKISLKKKNSAEHGVDVDLVLLEKKWQTQKLSRKKDLLARAVGAEEGLRVCDLTLGLAGDSSKFCYWGCHVTGFEENPLISFLVRDALYRFSQQTQREYPLQLHCESFQKSLTQTIDKNDVFYLDPMYAHRRTALPRKEMQYVAAVTTPSEETSLWEACQPILSLKKKLVVKRAPQSPHLGPRPSRVFEGKMVRFDVYG